MRLLCADHGAHRGSVTAVVGGGTCSSGNANTAFAGSLAIVGSASTFANRLFQHRLVCSCSAVPCSVVISPLP